MARVYSLLMTAALVAASLFTTPIEAYGESSSRQTKTQRTTQRKVVRTNVIITMQESTSGVLDDVRGRKFDSRNQRTAALRDGLVDHAKKTQQHVSSLLGKEKGSTFTDSKTFWLTNQLVVNSATPELIEKLSKLPGVKSVVPEDIYPMTTPVVETANSLFSTLDYPTQWGSYKINAPSVWATGNTGKGVVVGIIDTGARYTHQAITSTWRSSYGWYDPETKSSVPYDATGHGTHVTGTVVGANGFGIAPGATWIACKGCRAAGCYLSDLLACFQFMFCPTKPDGSVSDCTKRPKVVNNSWGGGQGLTTFDSVISAWQSAGMIPVFAAGNAGSTCTTLNSPGDSSNVISVGATDSTDAIGSYSSKGPSVTGVRKPDVSAPGSSIISSCWTGDGDYCTKTGTSMATPHVTGTIALYLSAKPTATFAQVKNALQAASVTTTLVTTGLSCGGITDRVYPNNIFGYGRIDAFSALSK